MVQFVATPISASREIRFYIISLYIYIKKFSHFGYPPFSSFRLVLHICNIHFFAYKLVSGSNLNLTN